MTVRREKATQPADAGFSLVEVIVAMAILTVVMLGAVGFLVSALGASVGQSNRQSAVALANQALDVTRAVETTKLVTGRSAAAVGTLRAEASPSVRTAPVDTTSAVAKAAVSDPTATGSSVALIPLRSVVVLGKRPFTVRTFIEVCWLDPSRVTTAADPQMCRAGEGGGRLLTYRITAEVTWPQTNNTCAGATARTCAYSISTLRDATPRTAGYEEPKFHQGASAPTATGLIDTSTGQSLTSAKVGKTYTVNLSGTGFQNGAKVLSSGTGTADGTKNLTATQATFTFTAGTVAGTASLQLVNPDGGSTTPWPLKVTP